MHRVPSVAAQENDSVADVLATHASRDGDERRTVGPVAAIRRVGVLYQIKRPEVAALAHSVEAFLRRHDIAVIVGSVDHEEEIICQQLDLFVTIGGDGTMLRAAHCAAPWQTPLLGINMGRLGFLTECGPADWETTLTTVLEGRWWVERRCMLTAELDGIAEPTVALNDIVLARGPHVRAIHVDLAVDGVPVAEVVADGIIIATSTGSTAYALAAGGPIVDPRVEALILVPVAAHVSLPGPLVLPMTSHITMYSSRNVQAVLSVDGQVDRPVAVGQTVGIRAVDRSCLFARTRSPERFYSGLTSRLRRT